MDTEVFGVSVDSYATLAEFRKSLKLPFDLLSDWFRETSREYGVYNGKEGVAERYSFLVDGKGIVRFVQHSGLEEARDLGKMLEAVRKLGEEK